MNRELALKIQSYLDGELSEREARRLADWLEEDGEAQAMLEELRLTRSALRGGMELERPVPETREFYWSKIGRALEQLERPARVEAQGWWWGWRKYLAPLAGVAMVAFLGVWAVNSYRSELGDPFLNYLAEVESPTSSMGSYSFRSPSGNMFVVWLYERAPEVESAGSSVELPTP